MGGREEGSTEKWTGIQDASDCIWMVSEFIQMNLYKCPHFRPALVRDSPSADRLRRRGSRLFKSPWTCGCQCISSRSDIDNPLDQRQGSSFSAPCLVSVSASENRNQDRVFHAYQRGLFQSGSAKIWRGRRKCRRRLQRWCYIPGSRSVEHWRSRVPESESSQIMADSSGNEKALPLYRHQHSFLRR